MFDLAFFKTVSTVLAWTESPQIHFTNRHEDAMEKRKKTPFHQACRHNMLTMSPEDRRLHIYVAHTYPPYFGETLRTGTNATACWNRIYAS